jgi:endonuclease YncB( thermonuclease family)
MTRTISVNVDRTDLAEALIREGWSAWVQAIGSE